MPRMRPPAVDDDRSLGDGIHARRGAGYLIERAPAEVRP